MGMNNYKPRRKRIAPLINPDLARAVLGKQVRTKRFSMKATNAIEPAAPASVWGYKGCAGKGGKTRNATIEEKN